MMFESLHDKSGLSFATINQILSIFSQHPALKKAILYGSRAKGNYRKGSDIDLTLIGDTLSHTDLGKIENQLDDSLLPYSFDFSLYQEIDNPDLLDHIKRVGIVFYSRVDLAQ